ncbi:glycosyltransferase [Williamsia muralis]|uniref:glycosyltransferase n=1 Tax=Williamsia marianensis TaxID=85044 RepID=UPI001FAF7380|nr:glycosyltransferase [Williamsia marianensis]
MVTLVSPDGEYGGPVRVATNQLAALRDAGHSAVLVASRRPSGDTPAEVSGVPLKLFRARRALPRSGFAGLTAPSMLWWFLRNRQSFDVVHVHLARDLVTLPMALIALGSRIPLVLQTHGMIDASSRRLAHLLDAAVTRRVLVGADAVLYLTDRERSDLLSISDNIALSHLANGVPSTTQTAAPEVEPPEFLFLARLHPRKRVVTFVRAATALLDGGADARFAIVGPDEGDGSAVRALIQASGHRDRIRWEGPVSPSSTLDRMCASSVYVLPAVDEPFPMAVLEAMSVGLPVVVTNSCGLAELVARTGSGTVVDDTDDSLCRVMAELIANPTLRQTQGRRGRDVVSSELAMGAVCRQLEKVYETTLTTYCRGSSGPRAPRPVPTDSGRKGPASG